jgi:hypothetical protein
VRRFLERLGLLRPDPKQPGVIEAIFLLLRHERSAGNAPIPRRFYEQQDDLIFSSCSEDCRTV